MSEDRKWRRMKVALLKGLSRFRVGEQEREEALVYENQ